MYKSYIWLLLFLSCQFVYSQTKAVWGKPTIEELALSRIEFEKDADAVILYEFGDLSITNYGYEIEVYMKIKILTQNGFNFASRKWRFSSKNPNDHVKVNRAQTINYEGGELKITEVKNKDIITENFDENTKETVLIFPNVKVGSIIEYKYTLKSTNDLYSSPWTFQNQIPTLYSSLKLKNVSSFDYLTFVDGLNISKKYSGIKGLKFWELENVPSTKTYTYIYNPNDYRDRLRLQYTSNQYAHGLYSSVKSWKEFKVLFNKNLKDASKRIDFISIAQKIPNGNSQLETLNNCIDYIQENYQWSKFYSITPKSLKDNLLQYKKGHSADFNLLLHEILKIKNIDSEFIISSFRSRGKLNTSFPLLAKMSGSLLLVHLYDESILIDAATSETDKIRYPNLDYFNHFSVKLKSVSDSYFILNPAISEFHSSCVLEIKPDKFIFKTKDSFRGYFTNKASEDLVKKPHSTNTIYESEVSKLKEWTTYSKIYELDKLSDIHIIENPISHLAHNYQIQPDRNYPIELDYPILINVQLKIPDTSLYQLDLSQFNFEIKEFENDLIYSQNYVQEKNYYILNWTFLINKIAFIEKEEIDQFRNFLKNINQSGNHHAFLKKL